MPASIIIGLQWGDEGKGKITDFLAHDTDMIVRYQGGDNAGHTVVVGDLKLKLHLIPSGILYPETTCILGNGMVINLLALEKEIDYLKKHDISTDNLLVSPRAHLIMPYHQYIDTKEEEERKDSKIGTTGKGIGPAYRDKIERCGIQVGDLLFPDVFRKKLKQNLEAKGLAEKFDDQEIFAQYMTVFKGIKDKVQPVSRFIHDSLNLGKKVIFEGAQGTLLDIDHGTYPYVTSSSPSSGGACLGSGIGPGRIDGVLGVVKAYSTRVGEGPFPTELSNDLGEELRQKGAEFGTTTGRPRRTGWLDLVALKYAVQINGVTSIALTKLDVLFGLPTIKACIAYKYDSEEITHYPENSNMVPECTPIYREFRGFNNLNKENEVYYNDYIDFIEEYLRVPVEIVSVGPDRDQTFTRKGKADVAQG